MKKKFLTVFLFVSALVLSLGYVRARFWIVELSYETSQKRSLRKQLLQEKRSLTLELETLRNADRIERIAKKKLGLTRKQEPVSVVVLDGGSTR